MVLYWTWQLNWGPSPPEDHIDIPKRSVERHGTPIMWKGSFHEMGTFNILSIMLSARHYALDDALEPVCPSWLRIYPMVWELIQGPLEVCLTPWDMGGKAPSLYPLVLGHYRLFYHQDTHETSFCALNTNWGPTWWLTWRVRGHPLFQDSWSPLTHFGTKRTQCCLPTTPTSAWHHHFQLAFGWLIHNFVLWPRDVSCPFL